MKYIILSLLGIFFGCSSSNNGPIQEEQMQVEYTEKFRPQFHFSPKEKWMNDPNGMVFYEGEYHLFYQYYPDSTVWGPMHWGHAVSEDLIHWEELPIALYPDELGYIFSGSAVIDTANTSGFGTDENPAMVAIYTYHDMEGEKSGKIDYQTQGIAFSLDKGRSWTKYDGNPVIMNPGIKDFRDPKVRWHSETEKWIMTLAVKDHISIYSSLNLIDWNYESDFGIDKGDHSGVWECPDLFPLTYNGQTYWTLLLSINPGAPNGGSGTQYFIGDFDGKTFSTTQTDTLWLDYGTDNYAGVTWANTPDDRTLFIGWMSNWEYAQTVPTDKWRSAMTLPRELMLFSDLQNELSVKSQPISSIDQLRITNDLSNSKAVDLNKTVTLNSGLVEFNAEFEHSGADTLTIEFSNDLDESLSIHILAQQNEVVIDRSNHQIDSFSENFNHIQKGPLSKQEYSIRVYKDESSIEVFFDDGELVLTTLYFTKELLNQLTIKSFGEAKMRNGSVQTLKSIWNE